MSNSSEVRGCNGSKVICGRFYGEAGGQVEEGRWVQLTTDLQTHLVKRWQKHWDTLASNGGVRQVACLTRAGGFSFTLKCHGFTDPRCQRSVQRFNMKDRYES